MNHLQKTMHHLSSNFIVKFFSLIIGFCLWSLFSQTQNYEISYCVPFCFYGKNSHLVEIPESITITLYGKRNAFNHIDPKSLAIYLDADALKKGTNTVIVTEQHLLLPTTLKMVNCNPRLVQITVKEKDNS